MAPSLHLKELFSPWSVCHARATHQKTHFTNDNEKAYCFRSSPSSNNSRHETLHAICSHLSGSPITILGNGNALYATPGFSPDQSLVWAWTPPPGPKKSPPDYFSPFWQPLKVNLASPPPSHYTGGSPHPEPHAQCNPATGACECQRNASGYCPGPRGGALHPGVRPPQTHPSSSGWVSLFEISVLVLLSLSGAD